MKQAHDAATKMARCWLRKLKENKKGESITLIKTLLESTQYTQRVLWAYRQYEKKIWIVQDVWKVKLKCLRAQTSAVSRLWAKVDTIRMEADFDRLVREDAVWTKEENERIQVFNQKHTGRVAGASTIEKLEKVKPLAMDEIRMQVKLCGSAVVRTAIRQFLLKAQWEHWQNMVNYCNGVLWPEFVELYRQDHEHLTRYDLISKLRNMRLMNMNHPGSMVAYMKEHSRYTVATPHMRRFPDQDQVMDLIRDTLAGVDAEKGPRVSEVPITQHDSKKNGKRSTPSLGRRALGR